MAMITQIDGPWLKGKPAHWLNYSMVIQQDDYTGNDYIQLQDDIRAKITEAATILKEHNITIFNIHTEKMLDSNKYDTIHRIAIGFEQKEDLMLAKMILKCNV
jgi:hypothetical protein